jgi:hypothetical protein
MTHKSTEQSRIEEAVSAIIATSHEELTKNMNEAVIME